MYDAIVVGLGPAGSTAAYTLSAAGFSVLGLDKEKFPRYKSCGGCISTKVEGMLPFDISPVIEDTVYGAGFTYRSGRFMDIISDRPLGYNVMRDRFDAFLVDRAREAGAEVREGVRIRSVSDDGSSVTVADTEGRAYTGRFLIGADGASGVTGRDYFGFNPRESAVSITAEVPYDRQELSEVKGKLFIDFGAIPSGYGWIFPKEKYLSVGMAGDACRTGGRVKDYFNEFISTHPLLKGFDITERCGWTVPIFYDADKPVTRGRVLLAGDTGHLVDPFLGEGIYYAIKTAQGAARAVAGCLKDGSAETAAYSRWLKGELFAEFRACEKISDLVYNHPRLWYSLLERDKEIMLRYYNVIRGEESSESFYGWVYGKVKSKPWKVLRSWVASRFIQT